METVLSVAATTTHSALILRPWGPSEVDRLWRAISAELADSPEGQPARPSSAWLEAAPTTAEEAGAWLKQAHAGWRSRAWMSFAVMEGADVVGNVALKGEPQGTPVDSAVSVEVSYWTAPSTRGHGVARDAVATVTSWAFEQFASVGQLRAVHVETNLASCRVAERCGYALDSISPANPPRWPHAAHVHIRRRLGGDPPDVS